MGDRHLDTAELAERLARAKGKARPDTPALEALRSIVRDCPAYFPGWIELGRALQRTDDPEGQGPALLEEAGVALQTAVAVSDRTPRALTELAFFRWVIEGDVPAAKALFAEGLRATALALEDGSVGLASVLIEEGDFLAASEVVNRGLLLVPDSVRLLALVDQTTRGV